MPQPMELAFEERGTGDVLLFIHGFPMDRTMWIPQLAGLATHRTCVAVDLRGHGLSVDEEPADYSMDLFADDVAATLDGLKVEQVDICGLSMGGYVAFALWRRHRERVRSLILIDTKAEEDGPEGKAGREKIAERVVVEGMAGFFDDLGPKLLGKDAPDEAVEHLRRMFLACPPAVAAADSLAMRDRPDATPDLETIDVPALWIHGEEDQIMPVEAARATAGKIPGCGFVSVPGAGHVSSLERPLVVNEAIEAFLTG